MNILDELTDKFAVTLDSELANNPDYNLTSATLDNFCKNKLSAEQASELNEIVGKLSSEIFHSAVKAGMKLGAKISAELLNAENKN